MTRKEKQAELSGLWRTLIAEQKQSGQTIRAFCRERGRSEHSFYIWRQRLAGREQDQPMRFALVDTRVGSSASCSIEVIFKHGERVHIAPGTDAATLRMVLELLRETGA